MDRNWRSLAPAWVRGRLGRWAVAGSLVLLFGAACSRGDPYLRALTEDPVATWTPPDAEMVRASDSPAGTQLGMPTETTLHRGYQPSDGTSFDRLTEDLARYAGENGWSVEPSDGAVDYVGGKVVGGRQTRLTIAYSPESDRVVLILRPTEKLPE